MRAESTVSVCSVAHRYGEDTHWVLSDVTLELPAGVATVLSGSKGAGKSTLLRIIAGALEPTSGEVRDRPAAVASAPSQFLRAPDLSPRTYLYQHGRRRGLSEAAVATRAEELAQQLGLNPGLDVPILSLGNAQKVSLAQAFLTPVDLLVLDEPRNLLDDLGRAVLDRLLEAALAAGTVVVIADPAPEYPLLDTRHFDLSGGRVRPLSDTLPAAPLPVTVRLAATLPTCSLHRLIVTRLASLAGRKGKSVTLTVAPRDLDELLEFAATDGWAVLEVIVDVREP